MKPFACLLALPLLLSAGGAATGQKTLLRYARKAGEVHRYRLSVRMSLEMRSNQIQNVPNPIHDKESVSWLEMESEITERILESGPTGFTVKVSAKVLSTNLKGIFEEAEQGFEGFKIEDFTQRLDHRGRALSTAKPGSQNMAKQVFDIPLPAAPVAIGETWRGPVPGSEYTFWGPAEWRGKPAHEFSALSSTKHPGWRVDASSRLWLDRQNGTLLGMRGTMRLDTGDDGAMLVIAVRAWRIGSSR